MDRLDVLSLKLELELEGAPLSLEEASALAKKVLAEYENDRDADGVLPEEALIAASTVFARVDRKIALAGRVVMASASLLEFTNPCQHAPYPEGRSCTVGETGDHGPSGGGAPPPPGPSEGKSAGGAGPANPFEAFLDDTPSPEPAPVKGGNGSVKGGYDMTGASNGPDVKIHNSVGPEPVAEYSKRFETGINPYGIDNPWTAEQPFGPDYDKKGKPWPGSNEWLAAHGLTREVFDNRPFIRFEAGSTAEIEAAYGTSEALAPYVGSKNERAALDMMLAISTGKGSNEGVGGFIQNREAVDAEMEERFGKPIGQIRPDVEVVINPSARAYRAVILKNSNKTLEDAKTMAALPAEEGKAAAVAKQAGRVEAAIAWKTTVTEKMTSPEEILAGAEKRSIAAKAATSSALADLKDSSAGSGEKPKTKAAIVEAMKTGGQGLSEKELALAPLFEEQNRAAKGLAATQKDVDRWNKRPGLFERDRERMLYQADQGIENAKAKLERYKDGVATSVQEARLDTKGNPVLDSSGKPMMRYSRVPVLDAAGKPVLTEGGKPKMREAISPQDNELRYATEAAAVAGDRYKKTAIKYAFPPTPKDENGFPIKAKGTAARVELQRNETNVHNFTETKGRVYLAMEGSIKGSAILAALLEQDPTASVIAVPSVTLWRTPEMQAIAAKYLRGREVVLIPDADGVNNKNVRNESRAMHAMLLNSGAKVVVASPPIPLKENGQPETDASGTVHLYESTLGSGKTEELKGVDDWLGAGRFSKDARLGPDKGTLGGMVYRDRVVPAEHINADFTAKGTRESDRAVIKAVSLLAGDAGSVKVSEAMLVAATGLPRSTARDALERLSQPGGPLSIEQIHDPEQLKQGKRLVVMPEDRVSELVRKGVINEPNPDLYVESDGPESSVYTLNNSDYISHDAKVPVALSKGFPTTKAPARATAPKTVEKPSASEPVYKTPGAKIRAERVKKIKDLDSAGKTVTEIAKELGVSPATVYNAIKASAIGFGLYDSEGNVEDGIS